MRDATPAIGQATALLLLSGSAPSASRRERSGRLNLLLLQQVINGVALGAIYVTVALAFNLTIGILNFLNFTIRLYSC